MAYYDKNFCFNPSFMIENTRMKQKLINNLKNLIDAMGQTCESLNDYAVIDETAGGKAMELAGAKKIVVQWLNAVAVDDARSIKDLPAPKEGLSDEEYAKSELKKIYLNHYPSFVKFLILTALPFANKDKLDFIFTELAANDIGLINERIYELGDEWDELGESYEFRA